MRTVEDITDTFPRALFAAAHRVAYGAPTGGLLEAAAAILLNEYEPKALPLECSNGASRCAIYVPAAKVRA